MITMRKIACILALLIVVSAALGGVNYRLNHPPLSDADQQFRALIAGADSVAASQGSCQQPECSANAVIAYKPLDAAQTRHLIELLRFVDTAPDNFGKETATGAGLILTFGRDGQELTYFNLGQTLVSSELSSDTKPLYFSTGADGNRVQVPSFQLHPRFEKPLRAYLDEVWPERIKPR